MSGPANEDKFYPNRWVRIVLIATEEIVGNNGVKALLNLGGLSHYIDNYPPDNMKKEVPFADVGQLQQAFWDMYGARGARAFAVRAGKKTFNDGLDSFGSVATAARAVMKIGSLERRIGLGLQFFAKFFNQVSDQEVALTDDDKSWYWRILVCPMCSGRSTDAPVCHLAVGVLQGALDNFVGSDKRFNVSPTHCIGQGDEAGIVVIDKEPL